MIQHMAANLKLNSGHIEAAVKYYKMAAQRKFTAGRSSEHVAASCLYIVCREERSPHLLLDFADLLKVCLYMCACVYVCACVCVCVCMCGCVHVCVGVVMDCPSLSQRASVGLNLLLLAFCFSTFRQMCTSWRPRFSSCGSSFP